MRLPKAQDGDEDSAWDIYESLIDAGGIQLRRIE